MVCLFTLGVFSMVYAAPLAKQVDRQITDTNAAHEVSEDQADREPVTTEYNSIQASAVETQPGSSSVETVKGLIGGFESAGYELDDIVTSLKDLGHSSNDIALGLISLGCTGEDAYNAVAEVFSEEDAARAVPVSLVDGEEEVMADAAALSSAGLSYEDMTSSLIAHGYSYVEIVGAMHESGGSAQEVLQILQNAGYGDREIVTVMLDGNYTTNEIVQGMADQGMSTDQILESFKEESYTVSNTIYSIGGQRTTETTIIDTGVIRNADEVVGAFISLGLAADEVISIANNAEISTADIVPGLSAGGLSMEEVFSVMAEQGKSESTVVGYLLDGGTNASELVNAMIDMGESVEEIFNAFKDEGNYMGEMLCVALINSGVFTTEEVVAAATASGISWDKIALGLRDSGSTTSQIIEILQSNGLTEREIVDALCKDCNFGVRSIVIAMNDLGWSMDTIIGSFDTKSDESDVVTGLILSGYSAEEVVTAARSAEISWQNITDGLVSSGMDPEEVYTILSSQGLSDSEIVDKMLDSGRDAGGIVAGLINIGMDMNSIFEAFKDKGSLQKGKSVVSALMQSGNYAFEEVIAAAEAAGMDADDIAKGMEFGGADFDKIVQYLEDVGFNDREVVTIMLDDGGGNVSDMVQGMVALGWDAARIFEAFKEEPVRTTRINYEGEGGPATETIITESNVVREEAAVVAGLVEAGVTVDEAVTAATAAGMGWDPIAQGLQQGGVSAQDTYTSLTSNGLSDSEIVTSMLAGDYNAADVAAVMLGQGSDMNAVLDAFTNDGKLGNAAELVEAFLNAGFETDAVVSAVEQAGGSWKEIASGLKANGFEPLEVLTVLTDNNLSDAEIVTAMLDGSHGEVDNLILGMQSLGWDMTRIITAFEDADAGKTNRVVYLLVSWGNSAEDVVSAAVNGAADWSSITQGLQMSGQTTENTYSVLSNNGLDDKTIAVLMVDAGYEGAELVDVMKNQGMSFDDIISTFTNNGDLIVDMSLLITAYKITP